MALNPKVAAATRNVAIDAATALMNGGIIRCYTGTQPTDADTAIVGQTLIVTLTLNATAFAAASAGAAAANAITSGVAVASSTIGDPVTWCRILRSNGTTVVMDGSAGTATSNLVLDSVVVSSGTTVSCSSFSFTLPAS